jgi:hypothetical protein
MINRFALLCGVAGRDDEQEAEVHALSRALSDLDEHPGWPIVERLQTAGRRRQEESNVTDKRQALRGRA